MATRLFLMPALNPYFLFNGFAIGHFGRLEECLHVEFSLQLVDYSLDVNLPATREQDFLGFGIPVKFQSNILVEYFRYGRNNFVLFAFFFCFQGKSNQWGKGDPGI